MVRLFVQPRGPSDCPDGPCGKFHPCNYHESGPDESNIVEISRFSRSWVRRGVVPGRSAATQSVDEFRHQITAGIDRSGLHDPTDDR